MKLSRLNKFDIDKLDGMLSAMIRLLEEESYADLTFEELCAFQDEDGSFKLLDSYEVPGDARVDFCHTPTYIGSAILMKKYLDGEVSLKDKLEKALGASLKSGLLGHGYDAESGRISAMNIFIKGGLREFLENHYYICPEFHDLVHNIVHQYNSNLFWGHTKGTWGEDYASEWQEIVDNLKLSRRLYIAYGSNMDRTQMLTRCPNAILTGKTYLENWELTMPHYANIERKEGKKTPALVWQITKKDEAALNRYEGYPKAYDKINIIVNIDGRPVSAMAYVMTEEYKKIRRTPRSGYREQILRGYLEAGFRKEEFQPEEDE
jgi:hypothetical protein